MAELQQRLAELARRPFDLENGPLFRVHILSRSASEHVVPPGRSTTSSPTSGRPRCSSTTSARRTPKSCAGRGRRSPFTATSSYADFVRWQHDMVAGQEGERHWAYWRQQLAGPLPVLDFPTDFARPAVQSYQGAVKHFYLDPTSDPGDRSPWASRAGSACTRPCWPPFRSSWAVTAARTTSSSAPRWRDGPGRDLEGLIGYFVNMLPMRGDLSGNPTFDEFLGRVRRTVA